MQYLNRFDSLKTFLDSNRDTMKLDAMRRIIKVYTKRLIYTDVFRWLLVVEIVLSCSQLWLRTWSQKIQRYDHSHLIPFYLTDQKIRKLVYIYLTRYAEEQQDTALLSVSTFQRSLKVGRFVVSYLALITACRIQIN